jgi:hypothetical protein
MNDLTSVIVDIALMVVEKEDTVELRVDRKACVRKTLAATNLMADGGGCLEKIFNLARPYPPNGLKFSSEHE